ncbi:MAG: NUDIX domain-containing protein [Anaerolineae bacterium]|nr:NUDIX domain-containing protein [Phycisphaerae bacterium]
MPRTSSGLLAYRKKARVIEVLLVHPGGPFWANKDLGTWTIPKGEVNSGEDLLATAKREFKEETGHDASGPFMPLAPIKQKSGKIVHAWAFAGDFDVTACKSNTFRMEWPAKSGQWAEFPEVDCAEYFSLDAAAKKLNPAQVAFLDELAKLLTRKGTA